MSEWAVVYLIFAVLVLMVGCALIDGNRRERRAGARLTLFCWVWPVLLLVGVVLLVCALVKEADLPDLWRHR